MLAMVIADPPFCKVVCKMLSDRGLEVEYCTSYSNVMGALRDSTYNLVVVQGNTVTEEQVHSINALAQSAIVSTFLHVQDVDTVDRDLVLQELIEIQIENLVRKHCVN